jgi:hypothetical protein
MQITVNAIGSKAEGQHGRKAARQKGSKAERQQGRTMTGQQGSKAAGTDLTDDAFVVRHYPAAGTHCNASVLRQLFPAEEVVLDGLVDVLHPDKGLR